MNATLERFCRKLVALDWNIFAMDADRWITVHPNGAQGKGRPALIDGETGRVKAGMGGKFNGQKISEVRKSFTGPKTPTDEQKKQAAEKTLVRKYSESFKKQQEAQSSAQPKASSGGQSTATQKSAKQEGSKVKKLRGENRKRTIMDFVKHQLGVDLTDAVKRDHKGNPIVFFPDANGDTSKNKDLVDRRLGAQGWHLLDFEDDGGLGIIVKPKDEAMLTRHAERMKNGGAR